MLLITAVPGGMVVQVSEFSMVQAVLAAVEMRRWDPFGLAVGVFAGGPALFGEWVIGAAGQREGVDVGDRVVAIRVTVVGLAEVAGDGAAGERAATISGVQDDSLSR